MEHDCSQRSQGLRRWLADYIHSRPIKLQHRHQTKENDTQVSLQVFSSSRSKDIPLATLPAIALKDARHDQALEAPTAPPPRAEWESVEWGKPLTGPTESRSPTPSELEDNCPPRPNTASPVAPDYATTILPSVTEPYMNRWRCTAACLAFFIQGLNDSAPGALLPHMENHYHVSYALVSLIFVANAAGFILAAPVCHRLTNHFGRAKVLSFCAALNVLGYTAIVCQPPFAIVVIAFFMLGFGFATILALDNVFIINLRNGTPLLGYMHGCYGIGGVVAPFTATAMVSHGTRWSFFYLIPLSLSAISSLAFWWSFRNIEAEPSSSSSNNTATTLTRQQTQDSKHNILLKSLQNRTTLLGALLIFAYQGAEVSISGWIISFLIDHRAGDPSHVGYVTSGFWGGITLGRFLLVTPAHRLGDRVSLTVLVAGTAAFQFLVWFLPNVVGDAVAVALIGVLLGPIYPCATGAFSMLLPRDLQITSLGFVSSMGSSGGAIAPFVTGLLAQRLGTVVLNPICIALRVIMEVAWLGLPRVGKRAE